MSFLSANAATRRRQVMDASRTTQPIRGGDKDGFVLVLSSQDISDATASDSFAYQDPPPTRMEVGIRASGLGVNISGQDVKVGVYVSRYLLDCVWRDSDTPDRTITSNSGTSISKKIFVTFYVGPITNNIRLLRPMITPTINNDFDMVILRNNTAIGEQASNPYVTFEIKDATSYFENQYTNQTEYYGNPGVFLGYATPQGLAALKSAATMTLVFTTDRSDYPSPFWYKKFLEGVSLWNDETLQYDIVKGGTEIIRYYKKLDTLGVTLAGGPFMPSTMYTFQNPIHNTIATFLSPSTIITSVTDPEPYSLNVLNNSSVTLNVTQCALVNSTDLSTITASLLPDRTYTDLTTFSVPVYDAATSAVQQYTVDPTSVTRFARESISFPNGAWRGQMIQSVQTSLPGYYAVFPWEQTLPLTVLQIVNETSTYASLSATARTAIVPRHNFIFMDPGTGWQEDGSITVGERALQFDLGDKRQCLVNKVEVIFPRSMEDYQPVRMGLSAQRIYGVDALHYTDTSKAIWFGGFQGSKPSGKRDSDDPTKEYAYVNTHTQSSNSLYGSSMQLMNVNANRTPSTKPYSGTASSGSAITPVPGRGNRSNIAIQNSTTYIDGMPTSITPASDFVRQEFGPFVRGATVQDLEDQSSIKAICPTGSLAEWTKQYGLGHYFQSLVDFCLTDLAKSTFIKGALRVKVDGYLQAVTKDDLLNTSLIKYIYPLTFNDVVANPALLKGTFYSIYDYILSRYYIYLVATPVTAPSASDSPVTDYIVKETYYPCPYYDQYDLTSKVTVGGGRITTARPVSTIRAQKMVVPEWASCRYFGLTCGSYLDHTSGSSYRFTRGYSNQVRLFCARLCTQLFNFKTSGGYVTDQGSTKLATFYKTYTGGMMTAASVQDQGQRYSSMSYSGTSVVPYTGTAAVYYDPTSSRFVDRAENLLTNDLDAGNKVCSQLQLPILTQARESQITANMADDTTYDQYLFRVKASNKTSLKRSAEFHLLIKPETVI